MPAHIGIIDRLKIPLGMVVMNLSRKPKAVQARHMSGGWVGPRDLALNMRDRAHDRDAVTPTYPSFRNRLNRYDPAGPTPGYTAADAVDWDMNLAPGTIIDAVVAAMFDQHAGVVVTFVGRKSNHHDLKRIEIKATGIPNHIIWSAA